MELKWAFAARHLAGSKHNPNLVLSFRIGIGADYSNTKEMSTPAPDSIRPPGKAGGHRPWTLAMTGVRHRSASCKAAHHPQRRRDDRMVDRQATRTRSLRCQSRLRIHGTDY